LPADPPPAHRTTAGAGSASAGRLVEKRLRNTTSPYSIAEAAIYCELSIRTLYREMNAGRLKSRLLRNRRRFLKADLDAYLGRGIVAQEAHP
jgi:excisionase family DNA binding protein